MVQTQNNTKQVSVEGNNYGQIAVGEGLIIQASPSTGGKVIINPPDQRPRITPRATPVMILPRKMSGMVDRKEVLETTLDAISSGMPVEFYAESGKGKTAVLKALAYHPKSAAFPDGVIYLSGQEKSVKELMACLYEAFYETNIPHEPSEAQIRLVMKDKNALILLDDLDIESSQIQTLMDVAVQCTFATTSRERRLYGEGRSTMLAGLPEPDAQDLFKRELGREPAAGEAGAILAICRMLDGHPLHLLQAGGLARNKKFTLTRFAEYLSHGNPVERLNDALLHGLKEDDKRVISALAMMAGVPFPMRHLDQLAGGAPESLDRLLQYGRLTVEGDTVTLPEQLGAYIRQVWPDSGETVFKSMARILEGAQNAPGGFRQAADLIDPAVKVIRAAMEQRSWENVVQLAKLVDPLLMMNHRWDTWQRMLEHALEAATALEDLASKAWALHQLGTRSLVLRDSAARGQLVKALRLRQMVGDWAGEAVTRHNLQFLVGPDLDDDFRNDRGTKPGDGGGGISILKVLALMSVAAVVVTAWLMIANLVVAPKNEAVLTPTAEKYIPVTGDTATPTSREQAHLPDPPTVTWTPTFTDTLTPTLADTPTATATSTNSPTPTPCGSPAGWVPYQIARGDTLNRLAAGTGADMQTILLANCLNDTRIFAGETLWLPKQPLSPPTNTPTNTLTPTSTNTLSPTPTNTLTFTLKPNLKMELVVDISHVERLKESWQVDFVYTVRNLSDAPSPETVTAQFFVRSVGAKQDYSSDKLTVNSPKPNSSDSFKTSILLPLDAYDRQPVSIYAQSGELVSNLAEVHFPSLAKPNLGLSANIDWVEHTSKGWAVGTTITAINTGDGVYSEGINADVYVYVGGKTQGNWQTQTVFIPGPIMAQSSSTFFTVVDLPEDHWFEEDVSIYAVFGEIISKYAPVPFPPQPTPTAASTQPVLQNETPSPTSP